MLISRSSMGNVYNNSARHLQFIRSIPTKCLKSTLVGMKQVEHVRSNLEVVTKPLLMRDEFFQALGPIRRSAFIDMDLD
jgi:aryl-alcohol dehydrogenase-like predicted oxidoreductase